MGKGYKKGEIQQGQLTHTPVYEKCYNDIKKKEKNNGVHDGESKLS